MFSPLLHQLLIPLIIAIFLAIMMGGSDYWLKISKIYFNEIKKHFLKDESRPDLKEVEMYYKPIIHYKGNKLYNIEFLGDTIMGHFCKANWKDKDENNKEKLGLFYERDLEFDK